MPIRVPSGRFSRASALQRGCLISTRCVAWQGFDGFQNAKDALRKRARNFKTEDRSFSLSSRTSPAVRPVGAHLRPWSLST